MEEYVSSTNRVRDTEHSNPIQGSDDYGNMEAITSSHIDMPPASPRAFLGDSHLGRRGNNTLRSASMQGMQRTHGNRAVQRRLASTPVSVQRAFWNGGKGLENDFWGTKELLGKRWGGTVDAASSAVWNLASAVPGIGTAVGGVSTGIDLLKAGTSYAMGDNLAANRFKNDAEFDALGMIPVVGDGLGALGGGYDASIAIGRAAGLDPENETPLSSDLYHKLPDAFGPRVVSIEDLLQEPSGPNGGAVAPNPSGSPDEPNQSKWPGVPYAPPWATEEQ